MQPPPPEIHEQSGAPLARLYAGVLGGYLLLMVVLWVVGLEGIYGHPTPFYALYAPATGSVLGVVLAFLFLVAGRQGLTHGGRAGRGINRVAVASGVALALGVGASVVWDRDTGQTVAAYLGELVPRLAWQLPALLMTLLGVVLLRRFILPALEASQPLPPATTKRVLWSILGFSVAFACAVAMIRGGFHGIEQAYERTSYEYIGDIGKTGSIQALFSRYLELHEHLSMHAKVHPPGPIALLWLFSLVLLSTSPLTLSLATVVFSALAVFPLYGWAKRVTDQRAALVACLCYSLVPSVVLFTATSADALFAPFTLSTLYGFERAIRTRSIPAALLAGVGFGVMALLKFSLLGVGAYFGLVGLWMLRRRETWLNVVQTAVLMIVAAGAVLGAVYLWSGYNIYDNFLVAKAQFDLDQAQLDEITPRLPAWTYRILNPFCWFYFAGIPMSVLFLWELFRGDRARRARWVVFALMLLVLNLLYLARGEGERSALYMIPFVIIPAASHLERLGRDTCGHGPLLATLGFLAFQTWFTETFFYTYW
jgi:hypothetical protein